jgi:hypothetical protein
MKKYGGIKICQYCGHKFEANRSYQKYCNDACNYLAYRKRMFDKWKESGKWGLENTTWEEYLKDSIERSKKMREEADFLRKLSAEVVKDNYKTPYKELHFKVKYEFYSNILKQATKEKNLQEEKLKARLKKIQEFLDKG